MDEKNAVELFDMKVAHVGINAGDEKEALSWAKEFLDFMGLNTRETPTACFSGELVEIMKGNGRGAKGHIGFAVNDCEAALSYFEARGIKAAEETKMFNAKGRCIFSYLEKEIGGFAIHLVQK